MRSYIYVNLPTFTGTHETGPLKYTLIVTYVEAQAHAKQGLEAVRTVLSMLPVTAHRPHDGDNGAAPSFVQTGQEYMNKLQEHSEVEDNKEGLR